MNAYAATARIERVTPHLLIGRAGDGDVDARTPVVVEPDDAVVDLATIDGGDPLVDRLTAARERWSQLTFYLFDAEGWR
jgi:hypothetical protein